MPWPLQFLCLEIDQGGSLAQAGQGVRREDVKALGEGRWETDTTCWMGPG